MLLDASLLTLLSLDELLDRLELLLLELTPDRLDELRLDVELLVKTGVIDEKLF